LKRRSATSSAQQRETLVFFIDHSLGTRAVANALREAGARVEVLEDHFPQDTDDEVWIQVARRGWVILTKDVAIRKRSLELAAVKDAKARNGDGRAQAKPGAVHRNRPTRVAVVRAYVDLLSAVKKQYDPKAAPDQTADAYTTLVGYFLSLRELGGMRRLVEDEVRSRCSTWAERVPSKSSGPSGRNPWFENRLIQMEPVELTSREHTGNIADARARLSKPFADKDHVDVLLASNMISVGVDIDRLGLMVVAGQPKTTSECIQATSRVGRQARWPGLVVTCFNLHKPRDRSHYERFSTYHESFYRWVEAQSLTPFSGPALERGLAGTLVAMTRLADPRMTPPGAAMTIDEHREAAEQWVNVLAERGGAQPGVDGERYRRTVKKLAERCRNLLDAWERLVVEAREAAARRSYSRFDRDRTQGKPLLHLALDEGRPDSGDEAKLVAPTSMRDVEPTVHLWLERRQLGGRR
jgi:hypothetical protein